MTTITETTRKDEVISHSLEFIDSLERDNKRLREQLQFSLIAVVSITLIQSLF